MIVNLTPHDVAIYSTSDCYLDGGMLYLREDTDPQPFLVYPAAKEPASVYFVQGDQGMADGIPVYKWVPHGLTGLPDAKPDTYYIVPKILAQICPERKDLIFTGTPVYDADDHAIGCIDFSREYRRVGHGRDVLGACDERAHDCGEHGRKA